MSETTRTEARCPDCMDYCGTSPDGNRAYCVSCGWFDVGDATHVVVTDGGSRE